MHDRRRLSLLAVVLVLTIFAFILTTAEIAYADGSISDQPAVCIIGAFSDETSPLVDALEKRIVHSNVVSRTFYSGMLDGQHVVLVDGGVGKVNSATTAQVMFDRFHCKYSIFTGIMGAVADDIKIGDQVVPEWLATHDWGMMAQALVNNGYVVQPGDSMSLITLRLVRDVSRYPELCVANQLLLEKMGGSCDLIQPGWILQVPWDVPTQLIHFIPGLWPETVAQWTENERTQWMPHPVFKTDPYLLELARRAAKKLKFDSVPQQVIDFNVAAGNQPASYVPQIRIGGGVVTGDQFVWDHGYVKRLQERYPGVVGLEMEGAAYAKTCVQNNIPYLVIRTASDRSQPSTWEEPLPYWRLQNNPDALWDYICQYQGMCRLFGAGVGELAAWQSTGMVRAILQEMTADEKGRQ